MSTGKRGRPPGRFEQRILGDGMTLEELKTSAGPYGVQFAEKDFSKEGPKSISGLRALGAFGSWWDLEYKLRKMGAKTLDDLTDWSESELLSIRGCGPKNLAATKHVMAYFGLALHPERDRPKVHIPDHYDQANALANKIWEGMGHQVVFAADCLKGERYRKQFLDGVGQLLFRIAWMYIQEASTDVPYIANVVPFPGAARASAKRAALEREKTA